ncbi:MAG: DUF3747 domain-containing protein [Cyanobacteriota bacterium]
MNGPSRSKPGTYLARTIPLLIGAAALLSNLGPPPQPVRAAGVFGSQPLDGRRFAILARPVAQEDWTLLVLEQVQPTPRCWEDRADGLVDPSLNRFDFSGICSRYLDSNGYSLRVGDQDLSSRHRLRLRQIGQELQLQAFSPLVTTDLVVARGSVPLRDRDGFVALKLEPGWQLQRRTYGSQTLSQVYFANPQPLEQLLAAASGQEERQPLTPAARRPIGPARPQGPPSLPTGPVSETSGGPVALQVIPYSR